MKTVSLFYMSKVRFGGFVSYTSHLCKAFRKMGYKCNVYKIRTRTERNERNFNDGVGSTNVSIQDALAIMKRSDAAIVTATFWRGWKDPISTLIENGAEVVIHDHTDYTNEFRDFMQSNDVVPIVIRKANKRNLANDGLESVYIPHPYVRFPTKKVERDLHAISTCRLDYDKRTDIIIGANELLPRNKRVSMWGTHTRMYMFQKIVGKFKGWEDIKHYTGPMYPREQQHFPNTPGFAVLLNRRAHFSIDMSAIKNDGGGTQYSFLEIMNGGAVLVLNSSWLLKGGEMMDGSNCISASNSDDLVYILKNGSRGDYLDVVSNYVDILGAHTPEIIIPKYERFLEL